MGMVSSQVIGVGVIQPLSEKPSKVFDNSFVCVNCRFCVVSAHEFLVHLLHEFGHRSNSFSLRTTLSFSNSGWCFGRRASGFVQVGERHVIGAPGESSTGP
jgi:hypothetical protein